MKKLKKLILLLLFTVLLVLNSSIKSHPSSGEYNLIKTGEISYATSEGDDCMGSTYVDRQVVGGNNCYCEGSGKTVAEQSCEGSGKGCTVISC